MTTRRTFLRTAAAGVAAAAVARTSAAEAQPLTPIKIGAVVLGDFGVVTPTLVGIEKGYFKQNGLDAELIPFKGGPDLLKGVLSGSADIGISGATDPLVFRERGTPIRALATIVEKNHFTLTVLPKIKRLEDLKGGTIGCTAVGSTTWVFARMLAKKMNWDPEKDVRIIGVGGLDAQMAGLKRGELQGTIYGDAGVVIEAEGAGHILMRLDELTPKWISLVAYSTDEIIKAKRDMVTRALKIASKAIGWPEAPTKRAYELIRPLLSADGRMDLDAMKFMQDTLLDLGVIKTRLPLTDMYTPEFTPVKL
jgi:NitT/TauT family transport system substrate-binding protein